jgi:hypothetical protein
MNPKLIFLLTIGLLVQAVQAQTLQLQPLATFGTNGNGSILPGQRPYLTDGSTNSISGSGGIHELQRSMAYNPTTGHLLILSRTNTITGDSYYVAIIDAMSGADVGALNLGTSGIGANNGFDFSAITVADDGAIYICDLTSSSQSSGAFNLYHWATESSSQDYVYSGDPSNGNTNNSGNARWGDTLTVTGTGTNTKVLVSSRGNVMAILTPTDPTLTAVWTATTLQTDVPAGNIGYGLAFGASSNTVWAKAASSPLYLLSYNAGAGTATTVQTYSTTVFPGWTGAIGIQSKSNLITSLEMPPGLAANVRLYDVSNTTIPPLLLDRKAWVTNESGNGIFAGSVFFGSTNVYALNSDNGIMAFSIVSGSTPQLAPDITLNPASGIAALANNSAPFTGAADGSAPLAYQWYFNTNTLIAKATNFSLSITNVQSTNFGSYYFVVTNSYGSATSGVATLTEAVTFKNGVVYEPFNYTVGLPLQNLGGWVTNTASVAVQVQGCYITNGNLSVPGLAASIGNHYLWASNVTVRLPFGSLTNGPLYFSFIHRGTNIAANTATEDPIGGFAYSSGTTLYPKVDCVWSDSNHYSVGMAKGSGINFRVTDSQVFTGTDTVFIVCCLVMTNGNNGSDIVELWVNPDSATYGAVNPPPPNCMTNAGNGGATADPGANGVDRLSWRGTASSFQHEVDELRVGFTWAAVTPPPPVYLAAQTSGNNVVVSWPTNAVGYTLVGETDLTSAAWMTNVPIVVQGTNNTFTVPSPVGQQFFRLTR